MANKKVQNKIGYRCKGNVMTPLNWFAGAFETVLIPTAALQNSTWVGIACFTTAILFATVYILIYLYIFKTDTDRLQSEEFNLHLQELTIETGPIKIQPNQNVITSQPAALLNQESKNK